MRDPNRTICRLRVRYVKQGRLKYLGHLEVLHTIERIVRRAGLPYAVTQGFSPHMRTGYSSALPVGTSSTCEWFDLFLTEEVPVASALERLVQASPCDLMPSEAAYIDVKAPALTAFLTRLVYRIDIKPSGSLADVATFVRALESVRSRHTIEYLRGKKSKTLDLDRTLLSYSVDECEDGLTLTVNTHADNDGAMRPELLMTSVDFELFPRSSDNGEAVVSCGMQDLRSIERYDVERISQMGEDEAGALVYPIPCPGTLNSVAFVNEQGI